ncbi:hypothetical protein VN12_05240 [Pirellula sp. SH-Sr6A]|nr:hypothetical protein VN12_05240 [Pirellula sp. SH-Sr6A]
MRSVMNRRGGSLGHSVCDVVRGFKEGNWGLIDHSIAFQSSKTDQ